MLDLANDLKDDYTIISSLEIQDGQEKALIENSKIYICILSLSFLNDHKCLSILKFASERKLIFLIKNNKHEFQAFLKKKIHFDLSNFTILNCTNKESDRIMVKKNVDDYFK